MTIHSTAIDGLLVIEPSVYTDDRGYFFEHYNKKAFRKMTGVAANFVQDNESSSMAGTIRGLHFQVPPFEMGKLIRVVNGSVLDVAVDLRVGSPTFGRHASVVLSAQNKRQMWVPPGFAHGFLALEDDSIVSYKCSTYYNRDSERCLRWNDPDLGIDWGVDKPLLSEKDANSPLFREFDSPFIYSDEP
ncbi:MAG: dTDP-4-dehydrorhamnose 3,5-epimerase [Flavobacteriales bacterium]|jgi:dTDP-4-dehydrorhamnose 3,5-epimerase